MRKSLWIFGILAVFTILTLSGLVSAYHSPGCKDGYSGYGRYGGYGGYRHGYNYIDTFYKQKVYSPYEYTTIIQKDSPYKSHYSKTSYNYGYWGYGNYGYNPLYNYMKYGYGGYGYNPNYYQYPYY